MNPRLSIFAIGFALLLLLAGYALTGCTSTDPNAGMVAARELGQTHCLGFSHDGRMDTAAVFSFAGKDWLYHPEIGSVPFTGNPRDVIPGSVVIPVLCVPETANLSNACLPLAIADAKANGGSVSVRGLHATRVP